MDEETRKNIEYEEQFYGMSSRFFIESFRNFVNDEIESKIDLLVQHFRGKLINQTVDVEKFEAAIDHMKKKLIEKYNRKLGEAFQENEMKIKGLLKIPAYVLLQEDAILRHGAKTNIVEVKDDVNKTKESYQTLLYMKQILVEEMEEADSAIMCMESVLPNEKFIFDVLPLEELLDKAKRNCSIISGK